VNFKTISMYSNAYAYVLAYIWEIGTGYPAITTGDILSSFFED